ncbi:MAG TPA: serine/threonine-protein kinase [Gemmatimonadales bacterium]|nr:serine/threonine-protein kinase [Gemmatimonadales bacterium]
MRRHAVLATIESRPQERTIRRDMLALVRQAFTGVYEVEREIGRGGNARIFLARDPSGKSVALKILHPELLVSVAADRFLREIKLASRLNNPHIARLLDSGERDWLVYYVMSYIEGATLREYLDSSSSRRISIPETLRIASDLLDALAHAHGQGIIHRDVKPANVVLSAGGAVLLDFGIARAVVASGTDELTRSGIAVGTSTYMSPEQITAARNIDHRCDLYSLGCMLFECLAGQPPFHHRNEAVVLQLHLTEPAPDVRALRSDTPADLADVIGKALAKNPADRWATALSMRDALAAVTV